MDNRQTTTINRCNNDIVACKVLKVRGNEVTIPLPWDDVAILTIISDVFEIGDWVDVQLRPRRNNGRVTSYSARYIGRTPEKFLPKDDNVQFVTA